MIFGIIQAAGKGTRMNLEDRNKTTALYKGKPLVQYGVELFDALTDKILIVIGHNGDTVKAAVHSDKISFVTQDPQMGTGHALQVAFDYIETLPEKPDAIVVGYGDHMMLYREQDIADFISYHKKQESDMSLLTSIIETDPMQNKWGRIIRSQENEVIGIVEFKDATDEQRMIKESNPGFYCFSYEFLKKYVKDIQISEVTGEYYITDLLRIAFEHHARVCAYPISVEHVGTGVNTKEELDALERV